jgi:hypothetical protein
VSSGCKATPDTVVFFGGMTKVDACRSGHLGSSEVGANVGYLFSNAMNQEQGNTIVKD